jgi:hypothetical protein
MTAHRQAVPAVWRGVAPASSVLAVASRRTLHDGAGEARRAVPVRRRRRREPEAEDQEAAGADRSKAALRRRQLITFADGMTLADNAGCDRRA